MRSNLTMANGSPKHYSRDATLDMNNLFSDTSSSSSSTCSDLSIPSCSSSSSIQSGHTSSRMAYSDSESAPSTPRTTPGREGSRSIPRPGKRGAQNSSQKNSQKVVANTPVTNRAYQFSNEAKFELQEDPDFWNDHNVQVGVDMFSNFISSCRLTGYSAQCVVQISHVRDSSESLLDHCLCLTSQSLMVAGFNTYPPSYWHGGSRKRCHQMSSARRSPDHHLVGTTRDTFHF